MPQLKLCLHSQTPYVRFLKDSPAAGPPLPLSAYREGEEYEVSPGGVSRMVSALLRRLVSLGRVREATWMSLSRTGPRRVPLTEMIHLDHVRLAPEHLGAYAEAKAAFWDGIHAPPARPALSRAEWRALAEGLAPLSAAMGRETRAAHRASPFDAFYVHDFQLLDLAAHLPQDVPCLFRWHIPVPHPEHAAMPEMVRRLDRYDAVIVSTHAYAERLRAAGLRVPVHARSPYIDEGRTRVVTVDDVSAFEERWGLAPDDVVFLLVARLDPIKSQDVAIRALARIAAEVPHAKLLLVGGGGFSGERSGGLAIPQMTRWRERLEALAEDPRVRGRVIFTGNIPDEALDVAFTRARAVLLPSRLEGFGLSAVEGWLYGKPVLVSRGAGVAELVREGANGFTFAPGDDEGLAAQMRFLAESASEAGRIGREGRATARRCHLATGSDGVWRILQAVVHAGRVERSIDGGLPRRP